MSAVEIIALIIFALGGALPFLPRVDVRAAFVCLAVAGVILTLDVAGVLT